MNLGRKAVLVLMAAIAIYHLLFGLWRVFHPEPGIRELGWTNPSAPGAMMIILGVFYGVVFFVATFVWLKEGREDRENP